MILILDTHVHIYPCYNLLSALSAAFINLNHLQSSIRKSLPLSTDEQILKVLCLTERSDCNFYDSLYQGKINLSQLGYRVRQSEEALGIYIDTAEGDTLLLISGKQITTSERLEILGLFLGSKIEDGVSIFEALRQIRELGGQAVVNWSPGKWFFSRGRVIKELILQNSENDFLLGDIGLRPKIWCEPFLMQTGRKKGFRLIAGSDPLPFPGEEKYIGSYATALQANIDARRPVSSIQQALHKASFLSPPLGSRSSLTNTLSRLQKNQLARPDRHK